MLIVGPSASDLLRVITSAAGSIRVECSYMEVDTATPPGPQDVDSFTLAAITGAATTTILAGTTGRKRRIGYCSIFNDHATIANTVTPLLTDGTNASPMAQATLNPGEAFNFNGGAWAHLDANGVPVVASAKLDAKLRVVSDVVNATTSFADVTGLTVALKSGKTYNFEAHLYHTNDASTTGSRFSVNIGAAPTVLSVGIINTTTNGVAAAAFDAGVATARDTSASGATTTGSTTTAMGILSGYIQPSADGTFAIRCASEIAVAAGLTVKAGSWLRIWETDN